LPAPAEAVLRALRLDGNRRGRNPPENWFTTLQDKPRPGILRDEVAQRVDHLNKRPVI
jgi:acetoin utilization protein AcuC